MTSNIVTIALMSRTYTYKRQKVAKHGFGISKKQLLGVITMNLYSKLFIVIINLIIAPQVSCPGTTTNEYNFVYTIHSG